MASPVAVAYSGASPSVLGDIAVTTSTPMPVTAVQSAAALGRQADALSASAALSTEDVALIGALTETAPTTDTGSAGLNGRLQRIAQKLAGPALISLTPVIDTSQYADGDILFDTIVMASTFLSATGVNILQSVHALDESDQGVAFDLVFLNALTSLGTINSGPNISDANARNIIGFCSVASGDYIDLGGARIATVRNIGLTLLTGATNLWVAGITRGGTPTYGVASDLKLKFGFLQGFG